MRTIIVKNVSGSEIIRASQTIAAGGSYTIQTEAEREEFASHTQVNLDIWSDPAVIVISNGDEDLDPEVGDKWLKGVNSVKIQGIPHSLYMTKGKEDTVSGTATTKFTVPTGGRLIVGGKGWFEGTAHQDDMVSVDLYDPTDSVRIKSFTDLDLAEANRGWYMESGRMEVSPITEGYELPAGFILHIIAKTGNNRADTFRTNIKWGSI